MDNIQQLILASQKAICLKYGVEYSASPDNHKVGISLNSKDRLYPINGLRYPPKGDSTGWFIWAGEEPPCVNDDYFLPLHISHLNDWCPEVLNYLGLPPGWRFLIAPGYVDVWFDKNILDDE